MGERVPASIRISGKLRQEHVEDLLDIINNTYALCPDWDEQDVPVTLDDLKRNVQLTSSELNYGNVEDLVAFCEQHGLDYDHWVDECSGDPEMVYRYVDGELHTSMALEGCAAVRLDRLIEPDMLAAGLGPLLQAARFWSAPMRPFEVIP